MLFRLCRGWKYLTCCVWRRNRILIAPGNWRCPVCGVVHLS